MAGAGNGISAVVTQITLRENGITAVFLPRTLRFLSTEDHLAMVLTRTAFCTHQIIIMSMFVEMRSLNPYRLLLYMRSSADNLREVATCGVAFDIKFKEADGRLSLVGGFAGHRSVVHNIGFTIIVEQ